MELYKRFIKFHDNDNVPCESKLEITTRNNYVEYTQCNPDDQREFNPKPGVQTELYNLWKKWHNKKYCEVSEDIKTNSLILFCNDICDRIEKEELDYIDELYEDDEYEESDIEDDKIIALKNHLEISNSEAIQDIKNDYDNIYTYGNKKYLVLTDDEADDYFDEYLDRYIDDVILPEIPEYLRYYFDDELWKRDVKMDGRESFLSTYNGEEHYETVNDLEYYIYRTN